jgi:hypothetical protein
MYAAGIWTKEPAQIPYPALFRAELSEIHEYYMG